MAINSVSFNNISNANNSVQRSNNSSVPAFKANSDNQDVYVAKRKKPSFLRKYAGLIGGVIGWAATDIGVNKLFHKQFSKMSGMKAWMISLACGTVGFIAGAEVAERL